MRVGQGARSPIGVAIAMANAVLLCSGLMARQAAQAIGQGTAPSTRLEVRAGNGSFDQDGTLHLLNNDRLLVSLANAQSVLWNFATGDQLQHGPRDGVTPRPSPAAPMLLPAFRIRHNVKASFGFSFDQADAVLWYAESGAISRTFSLDLIGGIHHRFSPQLRYLAQFGDAFSLWDVRTGQKILGTESQSADAVGFSPDDRYVAVGTNKGHISVWSTATGQLIFERTADGEAISNVAVSSNLATLAIARDHQREVVLIDVTTGAEVLRQSPPVGVHGLVISADSSKIALAMYLGYDVYDVSDRRLLSHFDVEESYPSDMIFTNKGDAFICFVPDGGGQGKAVVRSLAGEVLRHYEGGDVRADPIDASPDGRQLLLASNVHTAALWDLHSGQGM